MSNQDYPVIIYGKTYHLNLTVGEVTDVSGKTDLDIKTTGGGGTSFQGTGFQQSVKTEVTTTTFQRVFLTDKDGKDTVLKFKNFSFDCRPGNMVGAIALEPSRNEDKWVAVVNFNTGDVLHNEKAIENFTKSWLRAGVVFVVTALALFFGLFAVAPSWALLWLLIAFFGGAAAIGWWQATKQLQVQESASLKRAIQDLLAMKDKL